MFSNSENYYPNQYFPMIDFNDIKSKLNRLHVFESYTKKRDFGRTWSIENDKYVITVNISGNINIYYNKINKNEVDNIIFSIESIFKMQANNFKLVKYTM